MSKESIVSWNKNREYQVLYFENSLNSPGNCFNGMFFETLRSEKTKIAVYNGDIKVQLSSHTSNTHQQIYRGAPCKVEEFFSTWAKLQDCPTAAGEVLFNEQRFAETRDRSAVQSEAHSTKTQPGSTLPGADVCGLIIDCLGPLIKCAETMHSTIREGLHGEKKTLPEHPKLNVFVFIFFLGNGIFSIQV